MNTSHLFTEDARKVYQSRLMELQREQELKSKNKTVAKNLNIPELKKKAKGVNERDRKQDSLSNIDPNSVKNSVAQVFSSLFDHDSVKDTSFVPDPSTKEIQTELYSNDMEYFGSDDDIEMDSVTDDSDIETIPSDDPIKKKDELSKSISNMKERLSNLAKASRNLKGFIRPIGIKLLDVPPEIPSYKNENIQTLENKDVDPIAALAEPTKPPPQYEAWGMKKSSVSFYTISCPVDGCGFKFYSQSGIQRHCDKYNPQYLLFDEHMKFSSWSTIVHQTNRPSQSTKRNTFKLDPPPQPLSDAARASYKIKCAVPGCNYMFFSSSSLNDHYRLYSPSYINYEQHKSLYKSKIDENDSRDEEQIIKTLAKSTPLSQFPPVPIKRRISPPPQKVKSSTLTSYKYHCQVKGCSYKFGSKIGRAKHYYHYPSSWRLFEEHRRIVEQYVSPDTSLLVNPANVSTTPQIFHDGDFRMVQIVNGDIIVAEILSEHGDARTNFTSGSVLFQDGVVIKLVKCKTPEGIVVFAFDPPAIVGWAFTKNQNKLSGLLI